MGSEDSRALAKFPSLTDNINARVRKAGAYKISTPEDADVSNRRRWKRKETEEYFGSTDMWIEQTRELIKNSGMTSYLGWE